jgi:ferric-dicitrate binding protein FerR (iron transport regulator)
MHVDWGILLKYFQERCSEEEFTLIEKWRNENPEHQKFFEEMSEIWNSSGELFQTYDVDKVKGWKTLADKLSLETNPKRERIYGFKGIVKWAAALMLLISLGIVVKVLTGKNGKMDQLITFQTKNEKEEVKLADSSVITLNSKSRLEISKNFNRYNREVNLKGTAYFSITPNKEKPFIVNMKGCAVEVVGTSFFLNMDSVLGKVNLIVVEGKVRFYNVHKRDSFLLVTKNEKAVYSFKNGTIKKAQLVSVNEIVWKTGNFIFEEEKLGMVCEILEVYYGREIAMSDSTLKDLRLSASFHGRGISEIMKTIGTTLDLKVDNTGDVIYLSKNKERD